MLNLFNSGDEEEAAAISSIGSDPTNTSSSSSDGGQDEGSFESGESDSDETEESGEGDGDQGDSDDLANEKDLHQQEEEADAGGGGIADEEEGLIAGATAPQPFEDEPPFPGDYEDDERRRRMSKYEEEVAQVEEHVEQQRKRRGIGFMAICACIVILAIVIGIAVPLANRKESNTDDGKENDDSGTSPTTAPVSSSQQPALETEPRVIKEGTLQLANGGEGGDASAKVQVEYTMLLQDTSQIQYYLNTNNQDFFEQIWDSATTLYLTLDESPTIDSISSSTSSKRRQLQTSPSIPIQSPDFPYLLMDGYYPGDYSGMILVQESLEGGPPVVLSSGVFDTILDASRDIKDPNPPISTTTAPSASTTSDSPTENPTASPTGSSAPPADGSSGSEPTTQPTTNPHTLPTASPTIDFSPKNVTQDMSLWEQLRSIEDVQTFVEIVQLAGIEDILEDLEDATLFVPMDSAYARLSEQRPELSEALLSNHSYWNDCLADLLLYHVYLDDKLNSSDFLAQNQTAYTMASGEDIAVGLFQKTDGELLVDTFMDESGGVAYAVDARMDNYGSNGIYHILRHVLLPKWTGMNILETLEQEGFQMLLEGLAMVGLNETLASYGTDPEQPGWTLFAPTDDALEDFLNTLDEEQLTVAQIRQLLLHHVLVGPADISFALDGGNQTAKTVADTELSVTVVSNQKKTIEIDPWGFLDYPDLTVNVGDEIVFSWSG